MKVPQIDVTLGHAMDVTYPLIEVPFPDGVRMTPAVQYATPPACRPLTLDLYRPPRERERHAGGYPALTFIHGGSWARGDARASRPLKRFPWVLAAIAADGYVVASIEYRFVGEARWPAQGEDVKAAVRFLRARAADYDIDPERIAAWGVSCGGHLSGILATTGRGEDAVQAAVSWYGEFNMESIAAQSDEVGALSRGVRDMPEWNLLGGMPEELDAAYVRSASPALLVSAETAPMLVLAGDRDTLIPHLQSVEMAERMTAAGAPSELVVFPGLGHDFAGETYEQTRAANQQALELTLAFLDRWRSR